ncbi:MAG TPA: glycosyltransferase family 39 protein, partial [Chthoniobacterales bacterium]|nr:glycosyltransferase family 39 protein [Chthoniobacterales bacterium]
MTTGTGTLTIEETFLRPQALPPPPTRHALFAILIALAVLLHLGTIGIGDLYSETEGQYAAAAREMIQTGQYLLPTNDSIPRLQKPPLLYWLIIASYKLFGIHTAATRVPIALAVVATVILTFLIGERLADYWRGFAAGLIYLTLSGTFIFGRIVMPEPLFSAFFAGAIYCGLAGYQQRRQRRAWFAGFWVCAALACLTKGPHGLVLPAATFGVLAIFYREARIRFHPLLWWPYLLLFLAMIGPWYIWIETHFDGTFHRYVAEEWTEHLIGRYPNGTWYDDDSVPRWQFAASHLAWWFPWSVAILPALIFSWRRVLRPREISFQDALPMVWALVVLVPVLVIGQRQDYYALSMFSAFSLWAAMILERASNSLRNAGAAVVALIGMIIGIIVLALPSLVPANERNWGETGFRWTAWKALADMPASVWLQFRPLLAITAIALLVGAIATVYLLRRGRGKIAVVGLACGLIVVGLCMISGIARIAPFFSLADAARFLNGRLGTNGQVLFEGSPHVASSLGFYLERKFAMVNQEPDPRIPLTGEQRNLFLDEKGALEHWRVPRPVFLVIEQDRVTYWRELLTQHFHVYHQVASFGTYIILSNQL